MAGLVNAGEPEVYPIGAGAFVVLVTGVIGMAAVPDGVFPFWGGMVGTVCGGATAAVLADQGLPGDALNAALADVASSVVFFVLVLVGYLGMVAVEDGLVDASVGAVWFTPMYLVFGGAVAIPIAAISVCIAALSGTVTSLVRRAALG